MSKILIDEAIESLLAEYDMVNSAFAKDLRQALADSALDKMADNARELGLDYVQMTKPYRLLPDNGSKYFGESWDKIEQPAQQEPISILRYEPEIYREDRIRMELDSDGDWVKYADVFALIAQSPQPAPAPAQPLTDEQCCHVCGKPLKAVAHGITKGGA
jgi:hypothetical protein